MSLFNTANNYNVYLDIPDDINFSWNYIYDNTVFNLDDYIKNLIIKDEKSLIVLWGPDRRLNVNDLRFQKLNDFYHQTSNPMLLVNGAIYPNGSGTIDLPYKNIEFFRYLSKISVGDIGCKIEKNKKFFYASTKDYLSRRFILYSLLKNNLQDQGYLSYKCLIKDHSNEPYDDLNFEHIKNSCGTIDHLVPIQGFDSSIEYKNIDSKILENCYVSIITETFANGPWFFSEKIFNAMLYRHFFVYFGPKGSLRYLKSLGFQTWNHIIDESYDDTENLAERLYLVTDSLNNFLSKPIDKIKEIYKENLEILEHNRNLVLSTQINDLVISSMYRAISLKN